MTVGLESIAKQIASSLKPCSVLEVWGHLVFRPGDVWYDIDGANASGTSLQIKLRLTPEGDTPALEIRNPRGVKVSAGRLEIAEADTVMWSGQEQVRRPSKPAIVIT